ncbi:MAG: HupE/UreJ family protein [Pseudomonadota bacterium]
MTRIDVDAQPDEMMIRLEIDLGQSLMSPEAYWRATQAPPEEQRVLLNDAIRRLNRDLVFLIDGEPAHRTLARFEVAAISLDAIKNPLTPQMVTLHYAVPAGPGDVLQLSIAPGLEIPWPCLLTVRTAAAQLPQSRLLTDVDRLSRPAFFSAESIASSRAHDETIWPMGSWDRFAPWVMWIAVGFQHIVPKGLDHILFMLGLFFFSSGWRPLLIQVTGFTIAHSATLALSMYGVVRVPPSVVEPLIALSIVYVALDNLMENKLVRWRLAVVVLFGLLHGLGFASVLSGIGLPEGEFLGSLVLFNVGVELGQLSVLFVAFLLVGWYRRQPWYATNVAQPAAVAIAGTGAYWFLKRIAF